MKEKIYTIPVNDAFDSNCECPVCAMYDSLEQAGVDYTMGPSYMEDDVRENTDRLGFCDKHVKMVYDKENRLGMALVMKTHFDRKINEIKKLQEKPVQKSGGLFNKEKSSSPLSDYLKKSHESCFICSRIENVFERYIDTIFMLYKTDSDFAEKYRNCKGFCMKHYEVLLSAGAEKLSRNEYEEFAKITGELYIKNMERVRDDLAWFINKFDYKYKDEPWYNAKDSLTRALTKSNGIIFK